MTAIFLAAGLVSAAHGDGSQALESSQGPVRASLLIDPPLGQVTTGSICAGTYVDRDEPVQEGAVAFHPGDRAGTSQYFFAGGEIASSPKPIHLVGDARPGIVFGTSQGQLFVLTADGVVADGWPVATGSQVGYQSAAVADLDGDDAEDIVVHANNTLEAYSQDGLPLPGWPQTLDSNISGNSVIGSPVVADIDNDEDPEVLVGHFKLMYAFHHDGTLVTGWPVMQSLNFGPLFSTPAVADLDGDGDAEICFKIYGGNGDPADILLLNHDGTAVSGWPKLGLDRSHLSSPVFADVDGNGTLDIVVTLHFFTDGNYTRVYVWNANGSNVDGFPVDGTWNTVPENNSVGDVDGDEFLEIFVSTSKGTSPYYAVHAWNHDGTVLSGSWPRSSALCLRNSSPALSDIDGGLNEVVVGTGGCYVDDTGLMNVWAGDGTPVPSWPRGVSGPLQSSPLVMDSDGDGTPEIYVAAMDGWVHRFLGEDATGGSDPEWNQVFHDERNTNTYPLSGSSSVDLPTASPGGRLTLVGASPNPITSQAVISYEVTAPGGWVRVTVHDVLGRRVKSLVDAFRGGGRFQTAWDGRDARGRRAGAGVYYLRLESGGGRESVVLTLLR